MLHKTAQVVFELEANMLKLPPTNLNISSEIQVDLCDVHPHPLSFQTH